MKNKRNVLIESSAVLEELARGRLDQVAYLSQRPVHSLEEQKFIIAFNHFLRKYIGMAVSPTVTSSSNTDPLKDRQELCEMLLHAFPEGICLIDLDGVIRYASKKCAEMLGYHKCENVLGQDIYRFFHPNSWNQVSKKLSAIVSGTYTDPVEYQIISCDGSCVWYETKMSVLYTETGNVAGILLIFRDKTAEKREKEFLMQYNQILVYKAYTDQMTGALNRDAGLRLLTEKLLCKDETNTLLSICFIDIDNLKKINDTYGHRIGDHVILTIVTCIVACMRASDVICRMGGDEFLLIFPQCGDAEAQQILARVESAVILKNSQDDFAVPVSFSFGIQTTPPGEKISADEIVKKADEKMYQQKMKKNSNLGCI